MTAVMQQGGEAAHVHFFVAGNFRNVWVYKDLSREEHNAEAVLKAGVVGAGVDIFGACQLAKSAETLHGVSVNNRFFLLSNVHIAVYGIFDFSPIRFRHNFCTSGCKLYLGNSH